MITDLWEIHLLTSDLSTTFNFYAQNFKWLVTYNAAFTCPPCHQKFKYKIHTHTKWRLVLSLHVWNGNSDKQMNL